MVFRKIIHEVILVPIRGRARDLENIYALNPVADFVWEVLDGNRSLSEIVDAIVEDYAVTAERWQ